MVNGTNIGTLRSGPAGQGTGLGGQRTGPADEKIEGPSNDDDDDFWG